MLLALTCADLAAVGPDVLTEWKVEVLAELYQRTLSLLGGEQAETPTAALDERRREAAAHLSIEERDDAWFQRQLDSLPAGYVAARSGEQIAYTLRRFHELPTRGAAAWAQYNRDAKTVEFTAGLDQGRGRGAFSSMAGALSSNGLQILAADAQIMADDLALLRYVALDPDSDGEPSPQRLEKISRDLVDSIDAKEPPQFRRIWGQEHAEASLKLTGLPNEVRIDNSTSNTSTVIEVFTFDRTGLLYGLAHKLHELELTIWHAKIGTYIDQVVDVFYVTNRAGGKIEDEGHLAHIRREMLAVIENSAS
jgi:[protein-PII] uridylyltransferase